MRTLPVLLLLIFSGFAEAARAQAANAQWGITAGPSVMRTNRIVPFYQDPEQPRTPLQPGFYLEGWKNEALGGSTAYYGLAFAQYFPVRYSQELYLNNRLSNLPDTTVEGTRRDAVTNCTFQLNVEFRLNPDGFLYAQLGAGIGFSLVHTTCEAPPGINTDNYLVREMRAGAFSERRFQAHGQGSGGLSYEFRDYFVFMRCGGAYLPTYGDDPKVALELFTTAGITLPLTGRAEK